MMLRSMRLRRMWVPLLLLLLVAATMSIVAGQYPVTPSDVVGALLRGIGLKHDGPDNAATLDTVIWTLRIPRIVIGALVGASLAAAGAAYQSMFRNPLVSPDILGVSAGAGLGAAAGIFMGAPTVVVQLLAFAGGLAAVAVVYLISLSVRRHDAVLVLVLAGVTVGTLLGAGVSLLKILADPYTQLPSITFWLLGSLNMVRPADIPYIVPCLAVSLVPMVLMRWRVNLLSLTDEEAQSLGVNTGRTRVAFIVAATLMTSGAVAFTGIIGWVGLVIPHIARILVGPDFSRLLPASILLGAIFLIVTDTLSRSLIGIELPLGLLTALVGAPFFLMLLIRGSR